MALLKLSLLCTLIAIAQMTFASGRELFVSPEGNDRNPGTLASPLRTLDAAISLHNPRTVTLRKGTYHLDKSLLLTPKNSGLTLRAFPGEEPVISGGFRIHPKWQPYRDGIVKAQLPDSQDTDQLFVNGAPQPLARYPNFDPSAKYFNGVAPDVLSPERVKRWSNPAGAYIHALHAYEWGDVHYRITGKDSSGAITYEGGWQNNRQVGMKEDTRFVEGIFEELDAPGEWFLNRQTHELYYYPPKNLDLDSATLEGVALRNLIELKGSEHDPVRNIHIEGITFRHAARSFMDNREPLLRSDWTIYRGGAILATGTEGCSIQNCFLDSVGGNAVFVNGFNRHLTVRSCRIENAGANGIAFIGSPTAVRSPLFEYNQRHALSEIDLKPGPKTDDYPSECTVEDCLIDRTGRIEKQSAPVEISMSRRITIRHCSIYDVPRAGINIGDGCWGGHIIEFCDVFDTVKETGDHGSFNSWGRDRYWELKGVDLNRLDQDKRSELPFLDAVEPITLRNNRWRCDHGWDIDLDDGSSNFKIVDNLCLNGGLKLREGFRRICENNVIVNNSFHVHVWFKGSHDVLQNNIFFQPYHVIQAPPPLGDLVDFNLLTPPGSINELRQLSGRDARSLAADPQFIDPEHGNYQVQPHSPALQLGFHNFPMDQFGVTSPALKKLARTPELPTVQTQEPKSQRDESISDWYGAKIKNLSGLGERSATGMGSETGVLVVSVSDNSPARKMTLQPLDVILKLNETEIKTIADLKIVSANLKSGQQITATIWRAQKAIQISFTVPNGEFKS